MARKQRQKRNWAKSLLVVILTPLIIWGLAFLLWFFWHDLQRWTAGAGKEPRAVTKLPRKIAPNQRPLQKPSDEQILEEERKTLEAILKKTAD